jgi:hypothetical protein
MTTSRMPWGRRGGRPLEAARAGPGGTADLGMHLFQLGIAGAAVIAALLLSRAS